MGAPENLTELRPLTPAELLDFLKTGREIGEKMDLKRFGEVLEVIRIILMPMVQWLDKPLDKIFNKSTSNHLTDEKITLSTDSLKSLKNERGMLVVDTSLYNSYFSIALNRQGFWLIQDMSSITQDTGCLFLDSVGLAEAIIKKEECLLRFHVSATSSNDREYLLKEGILSKEVFLYNSVLILLSWLSGDLLKEIKERERRLLIMRKRLDVLNDFAEILDPFINKTLKISKYVAKRKSDGKETASYFSSEALSSFFEKKDKVAHVDEYALKESYWQVKSMDDFIRTMSWCAGDICKRLEDIKRGYHIDDIHSRPPLTNEEMAVIKKFIFSFYQPTE